MSSDPISPTGQSDLLAMLRAALAQPDQWPEQADRLLAQLTQLTPDAAGPGHEDDALLSLAIDDALNGLDISVRYPAFFQQLLADADLRQAFLEALEALEKQPGDVAPSTVGARPSLAFLDARATQPVIEFTSPANWRLKWQAALAQLQSIFFTAAAPVYRSADYLEDAWFTLFRDEVNIDRMRASVVLEAVRLMTSPDQLQLHLAVGIALDRAKTPDRFPDLRARLTWGDYDQAVIITRRGRATFPPVPLNLVMNESTQHMTADLRLIVEPAL